MKAIARKPTKLTKNGRILRPLKPGFAPKKDAPGTFDVAPGICYQNA
jgi:hypothetical protein